MSKFPEKTFIVARYEFLKTIRRKEFLFMTFAFPLFLAAIAIVPSLLATTTSAEDQRVGYIDMTGSFDFPESLTSEGFSVGPLGAKASTIEFIEYEESSEAREDMQSGKISSYLIVPEDFLETGVTELYTSGKGASVPGFELSGELSNIAIDSLLKDNVDESVLQRVKNPINLKMYNVGDNGEFSEQGIEEILTDFGLPFLTAFLLFFSIFSSSGYLLRGVAEEKENRIMEVLLSSATPTELLTGKVIGLGAVGLVQIVIWLSVIILGGGYALPVKVEPMLLFLALIYFLLGFLFFASMMAGIGAVTGSLQESQQVAGIFTFAAAFPLVFMQLILTKPDSPLAIFLSLFPFTSPVAMLSRIGTSEVPFYQIAASILILFVSIHAVIIISSRLFRVYLLMYGKRPGVKEILKSIREAGR
ncbi:ABC-type Na+ efflux pump, permease component [Methanosarcina horonobensis HB-1 = JCM 15518]|uniref:ABC-type Na+ efflux pump, permease component n=1 Tax=Methanosarcina horonobensis HB-1 = JCM 15518 TaxID=1434110 RepID=A0A0E3S880_9EURY|nr:ABC transporter permease [Methanosarcina horonobensis]AKB76796.1 ABC-type Na+ efflux pump, permease component [Methanosarcina horonobensis HB-1 = JCM 15518]